MLILSSVNVISTIVVTFICLRLVNEVGGIFEFARIYKCALS